MSLSEAQIGLLGNPFKPEEHGFKNGNIYIRKSAIRARLDKVDPGWELTPPELVSVTSDIVVMRGGLTIAGVTRHDIGTDVIQKTRKKDKNSNETVPLSEYEIATNTAKSYKSAVSAILSRAFVQFGGCEYLKDMTPKEKAEITDYKTLGEWLSKLPVYKPPPPPLPVQPPLGDADLAAIDDLATKHVGLSAGVLLSSFGLEWEDFRRMFPNRDAAFTAIANRLTDQKRAVMVYQAVTRERDNKLYLALSIGFAEVGIAEKDMPDVFATMSIVGDWKRKEAVRAFNPPLRVILGRNARDFPKISHAEQLPANEAEEEAAAATAPLFG